MNKLESQYRSAIAKLQKAINVLTEAHPNADEANQLFIAIKLSGLIVAQDELRKQIDLIGTKV